MPCDYLGRKREPRSSGDVGFLDPKMVLDIWNVDIYNAERDVAYRVRQSQRRYANKLSSAIKWDTAIETFPL